MPTWAEGVILSAQRRFTFEQTTDSMDMSLGKLWGLVIERPGVLRSMGSQRVGHD